MEEVDLERAGSLRAGVCRCQRIPRIVVPIIGGPSIGAKRQTSMASGRIDSCPIAVSARPPLPKDAPRMFNATPATILTARPNPELINLTKSVAWPLVTGSRRFWD